jgi:hypothetical protein
VSDLAPPPEILSPLVHLVYAHWEEKRAGRLGPAWREIDPGALKPALPYLAISEVLGPPLDLRYRLVGTAMAQAAVADFMGKRFRELSITTGFEAWLRHYEHVVAERRPCYARYRGDFAPDLVRHVDHGAFPLSETGERVDGIIEVEDWSEIRGLYPGHIELPIWRFEPLCQLTGDRP